MILQLSEMVPFDEQEPHLVRWLPTAYPFRHQTGFIHTVTEPSRKKLLSQEKAGFQQTFFDTAIRIQGKQRFFSLTCQSRKEAFGPKCHSTGS